MPAQSADPWMVPVSLAHPHVLEALLFQYMVHPPPLCFHLWLQRCLYGYQDLDPRPFRRSRRSYRHSYLHHTYLALPSLSLRLIRSILFRCVVCLPHPLLVVVAV